MSLPLGIFFNLYPVKAHCEWMGGWKEKASYSRDKNDKKSEEIEWKKKKDKGPKEGCEDHHADLALDQLSVL